MPSDICRRQLRCFCVLAEVRHFGRAAERLGISQPSLSLGLAILPAVHATKDIGDDDPSIRILPFRARSVWRSIGLVRRAAVAEEADIDQLARTVLKIADRDFRAHLVIEG